MIIDATTGDAPLPSDPTLARIATLEREASAMINMLCALVVKFGSETPGGHLVQLSAIDMIVVDAGATIRTAQTEDALTLTVVRGQ